MVVAQIPTQVASGATTVAQAWSNPPSRGRVPKVAAAVMVTPLVEVATGLRVPTKVPPEPSTTTVVAVDPGSTARIGLTSLRPAPLLADNQGP